MFLSKVKMNVLFNSIINSFSWDEVSHARYYSLESEGEQEWSIYGF